MSGPFIFIATNRLKPGKLAAVIEMLERQAEVGVPLTVKSSHLGGFTR